MKKSELIATAKDLNKVLGLEPAMDVALPMADLKTLVKEAITLIVSNDKVTPLTTKVMLELKGTKVEEPVAKKAKAKKAPIVEKEDDDDFEEDEEDYNEDAFEEITKVEPAPKKSKKAVAKKSPAPKKEKVAHITRPIAVARAIKRIEAGEHATFGEIVIEADEIYGSTNDNETLGHIRKVVNTLIEWGAVKVDGDTITVL